MTFRYSTCSTRRPSAGSCGITRPEVVVVLAVMLLAVSLIAPGVVAWQRYEKLSQTREDIALLLDGGLRFFREYGLWPVAGDTHGGDVRYGKERANRELINALRAVPGPGNEGGSVNPQHIVFLSIETQPAGRSGLSGEGDFLDPWGMPYQIVVDADFDNACDVAKSIYGRLMGEGMIVWSCGPDRASDTSDDILSWRSRR